MPSWSHIDLAYPNENRIQADVRNGTGPALILVPGTWGSKDTRGKLVEQLDNDIHLVCTALAGQDDNWPPPEEASIPEFSRNVLSLADNLGLEQFFVGGNSLGGMIAVDMLRFGPDRILGAVSIEGWTHWTVAENAFDSDVSSILTDDQKELIKQVRHKLIDRWPPEQKAMYERIWKEWSGWDILEKTDIPVLEIWGDRGRPRPSREVLQIPEKDTIELVWIPDASHSLLVEAPDRLAELINGFIVRYSNKG